MSQYLAELARRDPIAAQAIGELTDLAPQGEFSILSSTVPIDQLQQAFTRPDAYWLGNVCLFNARPDLTDPPQLDTLTFLTQTDKTSRVVFLKRFQQLVVPWQWAFQETLAENASSEEGAEALASLATFEENSMLEATFRLAARGQRLVGGFAVIATQFKPQQYMGVIYTSREFLEQYQFFFREAILRSKNSTMAIDEDEKRKMLTLTGNQTGNDVIKGQIIRRLPLEAQVTKTLFPNGPPSKKTLTEVLSESLAAEKTGTKQAAPPNYRRNSGDDKHKQARQRTKQARKASRHKRK